MMSKNDTTIEEKELKKNDIQDILVGSALILGYLIFCILLIAAIYNI